MNNKGNTTLLGITILMILSIIGLNLLSKRVKSFTLLKDKQELLLCTKKINGETRKLINRMEISNTSLKLLTIGKRISLISVIFAPGVSLSTQSGIKKAIFLGKRFQDILIFSYLNFLRIQLTSKCSIALAAFKTPYKLSFLKLKRNSYNQVRARKKVWTISTAKGPFQIRTLFNLKSKRVSSTMKTANLFSRLFSF